jgi:DNA-binding SARP family transcriptional activator/predicted ATPase
MKRLTLSLLGGFAARIDGRPVMGFRSQKARALLAYLVMEADRPHERAALASLFWPEMPDDLALRNLSQTLIWLRRAIGDGDPPFLLLNRRQIQWDATAAVEVDATRFLALVERKQTPVVSAPDALREAAALYGGEFLAGFSLSGCPGFDEWLLLQREYFQQLALEALFRLTGEALADGDYAAAATLARRQLTLDHWREEAIRQLLQALAAVGKHSEALAEYEKAHRLLAEELGVEPQPETIQLAEAIRQVKEESREKPSSAMLHLPPAEYAPPTPHNLPIRLTSLLGRESELATLSGWLLEPETRLVTISGIGGVGKTRLALAVAASFIRQSSLLQPSSPDPQSLAFPDGVWFVRLAGLRGDKVSNDTNWDAGETFVTAVAGTLGLTFAGWESPAQQLERYLNGRRLLLVLDNYEHLLSTRPILLTLLQNAPGVCVLVTSREQLSVGGERVMALEGLPLPSVESAASQDDLLAYSSALLFFTRALERGARLNLDESERLGLIRICRLAEGLPLAIELAATWVGHFTVAEIAAEMAANLDFLDAERAAARVDLPTRQRSPRAAFDYAWQLLSVAEQRTLAQLALLFGPFSREAAMTVSEAQLVDLISLLNRG